MDPEDLGNKGFRLPHERKTFGVMLAQALQG